MILIALGSNLPFETLTTPQAVCARALNKLVGHGIRPCFASPWYATRPVPVSDQPWFCNGVVLVETSLSPEDLLAALHEIEAEFGRSRSVKNAARSLDLDILDYNGQVSGSDTGPLLPHPRMTDRAFVLLPLRDVAPTWKHPVTGVGIAELIKDFGTLDGIRRSDPPTSGL